MKKLYIDYNTEQACIMVTIDREDLTSTDNVIFEHEDRVSIGVSVKRMVELTKIYDYIIVNKNPLTIALPEYNKCLLHIMVDAGVDFHKIQSIGFAKMYINDLGPMLNLKRPTEFSCSVDMPFVGSELNALFTGLAFRNMIKFYTKVFDNSNFRGLAITEFKSKLDNINEQLKWLRCIELNYKIITDDDGRLKVYLNNRNDVFNTLSHLTSTEQLNIRSGINELDRIKKIIEKGIPLRYICDNNSAVYFECEERRFFNSLQGYKFVAVKIDYSVLRFDDRLSSKEKEEELRQTAREMELKTRVTANMAYRKTIVTLLRDENFVGVARYNKCMYELLFAIESAFNKFTQNDSYIIGCNINYITLAVPTYLDTNDITRLLREPVSMNPDIGDLVTGYMVSDVNSFKKSEETYSLDFKGSGLDEID